MTDPTSVYDSRPWTAQYAGHIPATLETPRHASLAGHGPGRLRRFADQTAFTTVMPNGMYGSLSYRRWRR
jgi:long-chain acyl-CoA synthetase